MNNSMKFILSIIIIIVLIVVGFTVFMEKENQNENSDNNKNPVKIASTIVNYIPLEEVSAGYTINEAINDNYFAIDQYSNIYNKELIEAFMHGVNNKKQSNIRIAEVTLGGELIITDVKYENGKMIILTDLSRVVSNSGEKIFISEYNMEEYDFSCKVDTLEDGNEIVLYQLTSILDPKEKSYLCGYLSKPIVYEENIPNEFEGVVKEIVPDAVLVIPNQDTTEYGVSKEIYVSILDEKFKDIVFESGDKLKIFYEYGITEEEGIYTIKNVVSIEQ